MAKSLKEKSENISEQDIVFSVRSSPECGGSISWVESLFKDRDFPFLTHLYVGTASKEKNKIRLNILQSDWGIDHLDSLQKYFRMFSALKLLSGPASIIHCARIVPEGFIAVILKFFRKRVKVICLVHGEELLAYQTSRQLKFLKKFTEKRADFLIANSNNTADLYNKNLEQKLHILNPCIDFNQYQSDLSKAGLRKKLGISDEEFVIVTVARLVPKKNILENLSLIAHLKKEGVKIRYLIVGKGPQRNELEKEIERLNISEQALLLGQLSDEDKIDYLNTADLFLLRSQLVENDLEGFGIVLLEAQACGLPVITTDSGGQAESIQNGQTGYVVSDYNDLLSKITMLINNSEHRKLMSQNAKTHAREFDYQKMYQRYRQIIDQDG